MISRSGAPEIDELAHSLGKNATVPDQVAAVVRKLIFDGRLGPGERIVETRLAQQLQIGQPTAREALLILEHEGLVVRQPNRGCSVTKLSPVEIDQIYRLRVELEPLAAELATENMAKSDEETLNQPLERMKEAARNGDIEAWNQSDLDFHQTIWRLSANPFLTKAITPIVVPFFAFAELTFFQKRPNDLMMQATMHENIALSLFAGDKERARRITQDALYDFWNYWKRMVQDQSEPPVRD